MSAQNKSLLRRVFEGMCGCGADETTPAPVHVSVKKDEWPRYVISERQVEVEDVKARIFLRAPVFGFSVIEQTFQGEAYGESPISGRKTLTGAQVMLHTIMQWRKRDMIDTSFGHVFEFCYFEAAEVIERTNRTVTVVDRVFTVGPEDAK